MPLYESRQNAENRIKVPKAVSNSLVIGSKAVLAEITRLIRRQRRQCKRPVTVALEGWYGVPWKKIAAGLTRAARAAGLTLELHDVNAVFKPLAEVRQYKRRYITDDPSFGYVNDHGTIADLMDRSKLLALRQHLRAAKREQGNNRAAVVVYGSGAAVPEFGRAYDLMFYFDKTLQPLLWQMWDGELVPFAMDEPDMSYGWKEYYYCDFYLLDRQKSYARERMNFYVEGIKFAELKMLPRASYDTMMRTLVGYPIKEVKIFQPGPWGAYRYRDLWDVPGLECNAWNELAGPELSMLVDVGRERSINLPVTNLLQYPQQFVGPHIHKTLPGMFPMDVWLDDGYFPKPTPAERISMPVHNHPSTGYVQRHFNEPLGRYETYYITEAYEGANTWMGFKEDADLEEWEEKCRRSARSGRPIRDWRKYVANHASNVGDPSGHVARPRRKPDGARNGHRPQCRRHRVFVLHVRLLPKLVGRQDQDHDRQAGQDALGSRVRCRRMAAGELGQAAPAGQDQSCEVDQGILDRPLFELWSNAVRDRAVLLQAPSRQPHPWSLDEHRNAHRRRPGPDPLQEAPRAANRDRMLSVRGCPGLFR